MKKEKKEEDVRYANIILQSIMGKYYIELADYDEDEDMRHEWLNSIVCHGASLMKIEISCLINSQPNKRLMSVKIN